jgi:hypothetical protein
MKVLPKGFALISALVMLAPSFSIASEPVTVDNFVRAETDVAFKRYVDQGAFAKLFHIRQPTPLDKQDIIRMNRDTLYSAAVFDLTSPVTIIKPETGGRFLSMQLINQDHSMVAVEHDAGRFELTQDRIGTRYVMALFRTFVDAASKKDIEAANAIQDRIAFVQAEKGQFEVPDWDVKSLGKVRDALNVLSATLSDASGMFGKKEELNPIHHLLGASFGWGGNPKEAAMYLNGAPEMNDGTIPHSLTVKDVPVNGFWSITVYNANGFMEKNDLNAYSFNNVTAKANEDGGYTINFGGCKDGRVNCLPVGKGWNYVVRLYQPKKEILEGSWSFPEAKPIS